MTVKNAFHDWPEPCEAKSYQPSLDVGKLTREEKRHLWVSLKDSHPGKALEISTALNDEVINGLVEAFGASLLLESNYVPEGLRKYLK